MARAALLASLAALLCGCSENAAFRGMAPDRVVDQTPLMRVQARRLSQSFPASPSLSISSKTAAIDEIVPLDGDRILVGHTDLTGLGREIAFPRYEPYIAYDAGSGKPLWTFAREHEYETNAYSVRLTQPWVVIEGSRQNETEYAALDPASGRVAWRERVPGEATFSASLDKSVAVLAIGGRQPALRAYDLAQWGKRWSSELKMNAGDPLPRLLFAGNWLLVLAAAPSALDPASGRVVWSAPGAGAAAPSSPPILLPGGLVYASADGNLMLIKADGSIAWRRAAGGVPRTLACSEAACYAEVAASASSRLLAFAPGTGSSLWERGLDGQLCSTVTMDGGTLLFTLAGTLETVDAKSGRTLRSARGEFGGPLRLSDRIVLAPDRAIVASETGVSAFSRSSGRALWSYANVTQATYGAALAYLSSVQPASAQPAAVPSRTSSAEAGLNAANASLRQSSDAGVRWAQQNRESVYALTASRASSSSSAERRQASSERAMAAQYEASARASQASFERSMAGASMMQASTNFALNAQQVGAAMGAAMRAKADASAARATLPQALRDHQGAVQGRYFVRPFAVSVNDRSAAGLFLVDLDTGKWAQIPTSPLKMQPFRRFTQVALSADGARILTNGPGIDYAKWTVDDRSALENLVYPFVLGYDLASLAFRPQESYATDSVQAVLSR